MKTCSKMNKLFGANFQNSDFEKIEISFSGMIMRVLYDTRKIAKPNIFALIFVQTKSSNSIRGKKWVLKVLKIKGSIRLKKNCRYHNYKFFFF